MKSALPRQLACMLTSILLLFTMPLTTSIVQAAPGSQLSDWLNQGRNAFLGTDTDHILPPEQAFKLQVEFIDASRLQAAFKIAPGHYLYKDRIKFELEPAGHSVSDLNLPQGEWKQDPTFGRTEVFHRDFTADMRMTPAATLSSNLILKATYQGCSEKGLCYPPVHQTIALDSLLATTHAGPGSIPAPQAEHDRAASLLASGQFWLIVAGFFGFGLLLSLTPCVLPMIPILSGIIVGSQRKHRLYAFWLSLAYTLGMALSYTAAGVAAGLSGQLLSATLQNAWVLGASALVFILLALSMFGLYELKLPAMLEHRLVNASNRLPGGHLIGVFAMGVLSALIVSPCVAAPLAGALLYVGQTQDVALGATALFALSMGMGMPLLLVGASAGAVLPKAGPWMIAIRQAFGVFMLAVALWIVSPLLPTSLQLLLWAALLIVPAIFMRALDRLHEAATAWQRFWKGIAIIMLLAGATLVIGAASGAKSPLQPLERLALGQAGPDTSLPFQRIKQVSDLEQALSQHPGKPVLLDFYADWCAACKEMEHFTFRDADVRAHLQAFVLLQADVTVNDAEDQALLKHFGLFGPPGIIFFDGKGQEMTHHRVIGYQNSNQFLQTLNRVKSANDTIQ
ncbi:protein-disulfide reductase DsbD [Methylobacillus flagellatus]|uniref:Thiol:disulfide interchange protein DsbD n=1 Tax=Methylobacillus flagellatus (strain ATCC 51484 / DSM 6875 / VKM B-1610 / KT) TaxID=265072 RepID=Q1GX97_METFK|nr:protein-disulfide reductase DsbD [Methylobacillus flagellatus]ABE48299.1 Protein-disulfide reductase [Methylobacillus flagellatus KT]